MAEIFDYFIRADDDFSDAGPSLLLVNETPCIAWTGIGNQFPNVMPIGSDADGRVWFDRDNKITLEGNRSSGGVAFGQASGGAALMWSLDHNPASLVGNLFNESLEVTGDIVALGQSSQYTPALCWWIRELNMAWTGEDQRLNVAPMGFGDSGWEFLRERTFTSEFTETSEYEPALAWRPGPNRLYMAWTGEGAGELNIMYCQGGSWSDPQPHIAQFDRATKHVFRDETSEAAPSLYMTGGNMALAYRGSGNRNINLLEVDTDNNFELIRKRTSGHTTPYRPAYASFLGRRWIAYTGEDDHLYLGRVAA
jgi:hypothetical protein